MRKLEAVLLIVLIILLIAGSYMAIRNIGFFRIEEIGVSVSGPVTNVSADMQRIINPLKGMNIFEVNLQSLKKSLEAFDGVREVKVKRYFPDRLLIEIAYNEISLKAFSLDEDRNVNYYFIHENVLDEVSEETIQLTVGELFNRGEDALAEKVLAYMNEIIRNYKLMSLLNVCKKKYVTEGIRKIR